MATDNDSLPGATAGARALDTLIARASEELARSGHGREQEGLLFLGTWHDAYPSILVHDPFLTDSAKVHLLYLMQEARRQPHGAIAMPSIDKTVKALSHSRGTVIRDRLLLRVTRWISLCRRVRDPESGQFRGHVHAIHSEPCSLADATHFDDGYMQLLDEMAARDDPFIRSACRGALRGISKEITDGHDPLAQPDPIARRMEATLAVQKRTGAFFDMLLAEEQCGPSVNDEENDVGVQNLDSAPGPKFGPGPESPRPNFRPGDQVIENHGSPNFRPGPSSSSSNNKTTTTKQKHSSLNFGPATSFRWPSDLDDNTSRLVLNVLNTEIPDRGHHDAQEVIDALAHRMANKGDPLRSPVVYVAALCRRLRSGKFHAVGPPDTGQEPATHTPDAGADAESRTARQAELGELSSKIKSLEFLISRAAKGEARRSLEAQLHKAQEQLQAQQCSACAHALHLEGSRRGAGVATV